MSGLYDGINNAVQINYLQERFPKLGAYNWKTRANLVKILNEIYLDGGGRWGYLNGGFSGLSNMVNMGPISHKICAGYCTLYSKTLEKTFGPGVFNKVIEDLGCLEVINDFRVGRKNSGWTKAYRLKPRWRDAFNELYNESETKLSSYSKVVDYKGRATRRPPNNNAIRSRDSKGNNAITRAKIPYSIKVNQDCLRESFNFAKQINDFVQGGGLNLDPLQRERLARTYNDLWDIYHLSYSKPTPVGEIPQTYVEYESGRLYGRGISLQRSVREAKYAALAGRPLKELDMSNAHYTILYHLAARFGLTCKGIKSYLEKKKKFRREITNYIYGEEIESGLIQREDAEKIIKECLIAAVNGASTSGYESRWWDYTGGEYDTPDIIRVLSFRGEFDGLEKAIKLEQDGLFRLVADDIGEAVTAIIESEDLVKSRGGVWVCRNAMGKPINPDGKSGSQILSHFIRGVEAKILNIILGEYPGRVYVPMHDGFTIDDGLDPREIEGKIQKKLGFRVRIDEEVKYRNVNIDVIKGMIKNRCFPGGKNILTLSL